ncbi:MAG: SOS response-associated peptidase [Haloarculaceae archaeon]
MCGRYTLFAPRTDIEERFDAAFDFDFRPRYNAAPGRSLPVITGEAPDRIQRMEWGLVPSWADDRSEYEFINARSETAAEKPSFRAAYERRRCLVPADGFYEWTDADGERRPYRVRLPDDALFAMAGLYERWRPPQRQAGLGEFGDAGAGADGREAPVVETFAVLTTEPNDVVADLHHRMAVVLDPDEEATWLRGDADEVRDLLDPYDGPMETDRVSTAVNDPGNDSPAVLEADG